MRKSLLTIVIFLISAMLFAGCGAAAESKRDREKHSGQEQSNKIIPILNRIRE